MKRTYVKLSSELLLLNSEEGFMTCSVRMNEEVSVEDWHDFFGTDETPGFREIGFDD